MSLTDILHNTVKDRVMLEIDYRTGTMADEKETKELQKKFIPATLGKGHVVTMLLYQ